MTAGHDKAWICFDHNATTCVWPLVINAMLRYFGRVSGSANLRLPEYMIVRNTQYLNNEQG
jgi:hypothetical protein